jgi:hypothetical protein
MTTVTTSTQPVEAESVEEVIDPTDVVVSASREVSIAHFVVAGITIVTVPIVGTERVAMGVSVLAPGDRFSRRQGRFTGYARAQAAVKAHEQKQRAPRYTLITHDAAARDLVRTMRALEREDQAVLREKIRNVMAVGRDGKPPAEAPEVNLIAVSQLLNFRSKGLLGLVTRVFNPRIATRRRRRVSA